MPLRILPEPPERERALIERALARLGAGGSAGQHPAHAGRWRRAAFDVPDRYFDSESAARPRSSRGATRA